jgi:SNF2 family DNA or RNA helicase
MISRFADQLKVVTSEANKLTKRNDHLTQYIQYYLSVYNYIADLPSDIPNKIKADIDAKFSNFESRLAAKEMCQVFLSIIESYEFWLNLETIPIALITNREVFKTYCKNWHEDWESTESLMHCANYGAKFGEYKNNEEITKNNKRLDVIKNDQKRINNQIALFTNNEFLKEKTNDPCIICFENLNEVAITPCRHIFCLECCKRLSNDMKSAFNCPECRNHIICKDLNLTNIEMINDPTKKKVVASETDDEKSDGENNTHQDPTNQTDKTDPIDPRYPNEIITPIMRKLGKSWKKRCINKYGSKMATLVEYLYKLFENEQNRVIIFSQYDKMLKMIGRTLEEFEIKFVYCTGNNFVLNKNINKFKTDKNIRIIMLSSETSNSGSNLTEANHIIFIDALFQNPNLIKAIEAQAIGRAVRLGQKLPVKIVRFITRNTVEQEYFEKYRYDINILQN